MNAKLPEEQLGKKKSRPVYPQYGALCYRLHDGKPQVLLVTSRGTGRWIIPKGWPMKNKTACETATCEAWEEAGAIGTCTSKSLGRFSYLKIRRTQDDVICVVDVYPMLVRKLANDFPECDERRRRWFSPRKAAMRVAEPGLAAIIRDLQPRTLRQLSKKA